MNKTETMIKALRVLSNDIQSGDGVANACVSDAADMIENMSTQLAKANESVREFEHGNRACAIAIRELVKRGDIEPLMVSNDALDKIVNKFAIENKAEALSAVKNEIKTVGGLELCDVTEFIDEQLEQLRKERE